MKNLSRFIAISLGAFLLLTNARADSVTANSFTRDEDVIYGRKFGVALTMDVFHPQKTNNGVGIIFVVSGGWFSSHEAINMSFINPFLTRGYTVIAVVHG